MVAHHKQGLIVSNDVYFPIHVGKSISKVELGIQGDNVGDNISTLNPIYCEMTAAYWGWKNLEADYVGLCHYRRYFTLESMPIKSYIKEKFFFYKKKMCKLFYSGLHYSFQKQIVVWNKNKFREMAVSFSEKLESELEKNSYDIIVPRPYEIACSNVEQHFIEIGRDHIKLLKEIVFEKYPDFYVFLNETLSNSRLYAANMFIMKKSLFEDYCKMVFDILEDHRKLVVSSHWCINPLEEKCYLRVSGYLAEILTSAYVTKTIVNNGRILFTNSMFLAI